MYMDKRLPFLAAQTDLTKCGAQAASDLLAESFTRATDVKNESCYIISRTPVIAVSVKDRTLWYYVFIQNEIRLFEKDTLPDLVAVLTSANDKIGARIVERCGSDQSMPHLSEFMVSLQVSQQVP